MSSLLAIVKILIAQCLGGHGYRYGEYLHSRMTFKLHLKEAWNFQVEPRERQQHE